MRKTEAKRGQSLSQRHTTNEREREREFKPSQPGSEDHVPIDEVQGTVSKIWHLGVLNISS